jgi:hypothetical protein
MSAIITDNFRRNNAKLFLNDIAGKDSGGTAVTNVNNYYLGIGKSDKWTNAGNVTEDGAGFNVPAPVGSFGDELEVLNNVATFSKLGAANTTLVIPNVIWAASKTYKTYNSYDSSCFNATGTTLPCYATTATGMYLCLANNAGGVTANSPTDISTYIPALGGDNYVWILVQPVSQLGSAFVTDQFIEVSQTALTGSALTASTLYGGLCSTFHIANGGTGYATTATTSAVLRGSDGTGANTTTFSIALTLTIVGGVITAASHGLNLVSNTTIRNLQAASVEITTAAGVGAVIVPVIAPKLGYGHIPSVVMPSFYAGIAVDLVNGISSDNFYTPYRQISIVRNPNTTAATANALRSLTLSGTAPSIEIGGSVLIYDTSDKPLAWADAVSGGSLYFHQNYVSGFREIPASGSFRIAVGGTNFTYTALVASECTADCVFPRIKGDVVFTENRKKIVRSSGQTEKLKIIIQF